MTRIIRYDRGYSRRKFLRDASLGLLSTGVLAPLHKVIAATGDVSKAYPDELISIEAYTKGKLKPGDTIDAGNVQYVKDLLEPVRYEQILKMGRKLKLRATTTDIMKMSPWEFIEATQRNAGKAGYDAHGNVINKANGQPWIGGNPFPDPKTATDLMAAQTLNWGRHDASFYAFKEYDVAANGQVEFNYSGGWAEMQTVARISMDPKPYIEKFKDKLRFQTVFFLTPTAFRGTSFLSIWDYDQRVFPKLYGYVAEFRRVRQFPTDQRFEPLVPGSSLYLSDVWGAGDPMMTWGNFKIVGRGPFLGGSFTGNWNPDAPNWEHKTHGGPKGQSFWDTEVELFPETIIVECEPTGFPRAPISKKRVYFDARTQLLVSMVTYDRRGQPFRSFDGAYAHYEAGAKSVMDGKHPYWSWTHLTASDIQTGRLTRLEQVKSLEGKYSSGANDPGMFEKYLTQAALTRLGAN